MPPTGAARRNRKEAGGLYEVRPGREHRLVTCALATAPWTSSASDRATGYGARHDPDTEKAAKVFTDVHAPLARQPVQAHVVAHEGAPLSVVWMLVKCPDVAVTVQSDEPLVRASRHGLTFDFLVGQLGRLGGTAYALAELTADVEGEPFVPAFPAQSAAPGGG